MTIAVVIDWWRERERHKERERERERHKERERLRIVQSNLDLSRLVFI